MALEIKLTHTDIHARRSLRREKRALWRLAAWGGGAAIALCAVSLAAQSETGSQRLASAFERASQPDPATLVAAAEKRANEAQAEMRRLAAEVHALRTDRDRLNARLASLEHDIDLTGSIARQAAPAKQGTPPDAPPLRPAHVATPPAPKPTVPIIRPLAMPPTDSAASWPNAPPPPAKEEPAPLAAPPAPASPPPVAATPPTPAAAAPKPPVLVHVPLPPVRVAALPAKPPAPAKRQFAVDLGGALASESLRARWAEVKANFGPRLTHLYPLVAHDRRFGHTPYRLLLGPLPSPAAAARLCAELRLSRAACRPARFAGEPLARR